MPETVVLKAAAETVPNKLAGAICGAIREGKTVEVHAIGAGAVNQTVKAVAIARGYVAPQGWDLYVALGFTDLIIDGQERTTIRFVLRCL